MKQIVFFLLIIIMASAVISESMTFDTGWHLISGDTVNQLISDSELLNQEYYLFFLDPITKSYVNTDDSEYDESGITSLYRSEEAVEIILGAWIYLPVDVTIDWQFKQTRHVNFKDSFLLVKGWNIISLSSSAADKELQEIKGTCSIEKVYTFDSSSQQWNGGLWNNVKTEMIDKVATLSGFAIKVKESCYLDMKSTTIGSPPSLPS